MTASEIFNLILGGGLVTAIIGLLTLKAAVKKANAEAEEANARAKKAEADAEAVRITNADNATRILLENIVKPLQQELHDTREKLSKTEQAVTSMQKELSSTKRSMSRLARALESISACPHADNCPVSARLCDVKTDASTYYFGDIIRAYRQPDNRNKGDP